MQVWSKLYLLIIMIKFIIAIVLLLLSTTINLFAQSNQWQKLEAKRDSLHQISAAREEVKVLDDLLDYCLANGKDSLHFEYLGMFGEAYKNLGQTANWLEKGHTQRTLAETKWHGRPYFLAKAHLSLSNYFTYESLWDSASYYNGLAEKYAEQCGAKRIIFGVRGNEGKQLRNDPRNAIPKLREAIEIGLEIGDVAYEVSTYYNTLALAYMNLQLYDSMLIMANEARVLKESINATDDFEYAAVINNIGLAYQYLGQPLKGLDYSRFFLTRIAAINGKDHVYYKFALNNHGSRLNMSGRYDEGETYLLKSLDVAPDHVLSATAWANLAYGYMQRGEELDQAIKYYELAIDFFGANHRNYPVILGNMSKVYALMGDREKHLQCIKRSGESRQRLFGKEDFTMHEYYFLMGDYHEKYGESTQAVTFYDSALNRLGYVEHATVFHSPKPQTLFSVLSKKATALLSLSPSDAEMTYKEAVRLNQQLCMQEITETHRTKLRAGIKEMTDGFVSHLADEYDQQQDRRILEDMMTYMEASRAFSLLNNLTSKTSAQDDASYQVNQLRYSLDTLKHQLAMGELDEAEKKDHQEQIVKTQLEIEELNEGCISCAVSHDQVVDREELLKTLDEDEIILSYYQCEGKLFILGFAKDCSFLESKAWGKSQKTALKRLSQLNGVKVEDNIEYLKAVFDIQSELAQWMKPEASLDDYSSLYIIPQEELALISFDVVNDGAEGYWGTSKRLIVNYSLSLMHELEKLRSGRGSGFATFAPVRFGDEEIAANEDTLSTRFVLASGSLTQLPGSLETADFLYKTFKADKYTHELATKDQLSELLAKNQILHIATHGEANLSNSLYSNLKTADGDQIHVYEIFRRKVNADLVTFAACEIGVGKAHTGEGVMSMGSAFMSSGAKAVVTTLWKVPDESAKIIMGHFYTNLQNGMDKAEALRKAKQSYIAEAPPEMQAPQFWAGFVLMGDASPVSFGSGVGYWPWIAGAMVIVLAVLVLGRRKNAA